MLYWGWRGEHKQLFWEEDPNWGEKCNKQALENIAPGPFVVQLLVFSVLFRWNLEERGNPWFRH